MRSSERKNLAEAVMKRSKLRPVRVAFLKTSLEAPLLHDFVWRAMTEALPPEQSSIRALARREAMIVAPGLALEVPASSRD